MKRVVLLIYALTVIVVHTSSLYIREPRISRNYDDEAAFGNFTLDLAEEMNMSRAEVQNCLDKTDIKTSDITRTYQLLVNDVNTTGTEKSSLKIGCFLACTAETNIPDPHNKDKVIEYFLDSFFRIKDPTLEELANQISNCLQQIQSSNECVLYRDIVFCQIRLLQQLQLMTAGQL